MADDLEGGYIPEKALEGQARAVKEQELKLSNRRLWASRLRPLVTYEYWPHMEAELLSMLRDAEHRAARTPDPDQWKSAKGEIIAIEQLLQLKKKVQESL